MAVVKTFEDKSIERALGRLHRFSLAGLYIKTDDTLGTFQSVTHLTPYSGLSVEVRKSHADLYTYVLGSHGFTVSIESLRMERFRSALRNCENAQGLGFSEAAKESARLTKRVLRSLVADIKLHSEEYNVVRDKFNVSFELMYPLHVALRRDPT